MHHAFCTRAHGALNSKTSQSACCRRFHDFNYRILHCFLSGLTYHLTEAFSSGLGDLGQPALGQAAEEFRVRLAVGSLQFDPEAAAVAGFGLDTDFAVHAVHHLADQRVEG